VLTLLSCVSARAHLIDEVAANIVVDLQTRDGAVFVLTYALHRDQVDAFYDQARQLGVPRDRSDAAFAAELAAGFAYEGCKATPTGAPATAPRPGFLAYKLTLDCGRPMRKLELHRVDYNREKTRTTLFIGVRVQGHDTRRLLVPPRMAAVALPVVGEGMALPVPATRAAPGDRRRKDAADPHGDHGAETETGDYPEPDKARRGRWLAKLRPPPADIMFAWSWHGVLHLAGGVDHLLFLLALVLAAISVGRLLLAVLAFSVGHMAAMATAVVFALPGHWLVEVGIGLSICWAGALALGRTREAAGGSARLQSKVGALFFGLVHGWAFGSELRAMLAGSEGVLWPLVGFGVGLDLAQMAWCALLFGAGRLLGVTREPFRLRDVMAWVVVAGGAAFALRALVGAFTGS